MVKEVCRKCKHFMRFYSIQQNHAYASLKGMVYEGIGRCMNEASEEKDYIHADFSSCMWFEENAKDA